MRAWFDPSAKYVILNRSGFWESLLQGLYRTRTEPIEPLKIALLDRVK